MRRPSWLLATAGTLLVLLAVLATLQYRWLGEVSNAERDRLRAGLRTRASEFAQDFDRELTRTYAAFHIDAAAFERDPAAALADAYANAQAQSDVGGIVKDVYLFDTRHDDALQHLDPQARTLEPSAWPDRLSTLRRRAAQAHVFFSAPGSPPPFLTAEAIDAIAPALVVPIPFFRQVNVGDALPSPTEISRNARSIIVWLDADRLQHQLLAGLVAKHFGSGADSEYIVSVVARASPERAIYGEAVTPQTAEVAIGMFDLRGDDLNHFASSVLAQLPPGAVTVKDRVAITIVRKSGGSEQRAVAGGPEETGAWLALIRFKSGSLDALVAQSRRRNLAVSLGVLVLLAGSVLLVLASAERQRRVSQQQMEFVAAVSHELRTPLAVIRSAGENLADGLVTGEHVARYGSLIRAEGRRLSDMVERVMEFAGIGSGAPIRWRPDVDVPRLIADAVRGVDAEARERGVTLAVHGAGTLPAVAGDADALRSAVQNIIGNAVKYSPSGATVDVTTEARNGGVQIRVADRGLGIDPPDLPHIFKPFYRGRRAVDAQVRGSGVGLSVVKHVVDAHHATIAVESRAGEGTTVTVELLPDLAEPQLRPSGS